MNQPPADITIDVFHKPPLVLGDDGTPDPNRDQGWAWVHALRIPVADLQAVQPFPVPYKCIRLASGAILNVPGRLTTSKEPSSPDIDYDAPLPDVSQKLYFHYAQDADRTKLFPVDPGMSSSRSHSTSEFSSESRRADFREHLLQRDGGCCVTGITDPLGLDAVHLVTRARGNEYYRRLLARRREEEDGDGDEESTNDGDEESVNDQDEPGDSQDEHGDAPLEIDEIRNGMLLSKIIHAFLSKCIEFLRTPNFAMDTTDIDPTATDPREQKVFAQALNASGVISLGRDNNVPLRLPSGESSRLSPYPELFDYTYACAFLATFGVPTVQADISARWQNHFYPGGAMNAANRARDLAHSAVNKACNDEKRDRRAERRRQHGPAEVFSIHDWLMLHRYSLIAPERLEAVMLAGQERQDAARKETVMHWLENVPSGCGAD